MRNYLNRNKPTDYADYIYTKYAGNQTDFNSYLAYDVYNYQPMVIAMKNNTTSTVNWPYKTGGHFLLCAGLLTWENNMYFMGDPYYFSSYVPGADNTGYHNKSWGQLNTVITNSHGSGNQHIVW